MYEVVSMILRKISVIALALSVLTACGGGDSNSAPAFSNTELRFTLDEDTKLTAQAEATDADGDTLNYMLESAANNGVFQLLQNGHFSYSPFADFHGTDHVRLSVSDGKDRAVVDLTFTIHNVNDIPKILSTNVIVSSSGITTGKIEAFDQDGDVLTFSLASSPENGTLEINSSTGEFVYTPEVLSMIDGSFLVAVTDGIIETPVTQQIELRASYITNADKLNYYYSSNSSHLKKSEDVIAQLPDDNAKDTANTELASGYLIAGFQSKAEEILGNAITEAGAQALAYRNASTHADAIGNTALGNHYRSLSSRLYTQKLLEKGIANITTADASFMMSLARYYRQAGAVSDSAALMSQLKSFALASKTEVYSTIYGNFLTAYQLNTNALIDNYLAEPTEAHRLEALSAIEDYAELAEQTSYEIPTSGAYRGQKVYRYRALHLSYVAERFQQINAVEKAKEYLAKTLAIYADTNYDSNYSYSKSSYATTTLGYYSFPLQSSAGLFQYHYPTLGTNLPLSLLPATGTATTNAKNDIAFNKALQKLQAGNDTATVLAELKTSYSRLRDYYPVLFENGSANPGLAWDLFYSGHRDKALELMQLASTLLNSEEYFAERSSAAYMLGSYGCYRLVQAYQQMAADDLANQQALHCESIAAQYFHPDKKRLDISQSILGYRYLISTAQLAGRTETAQSSATLLTSLLASLTDTQQRFISSSNAASLLASAGFYTQAGDLQAKAYQDLDSLLAGSLTQEQLSELLKALLTYSGDLYEATDIDTTFNQRNYIRALRYASATAKTVDIPAAYQALQQRVSVFNAKIALLSVNEQQELHENQIKLNLASDLSEQALAIIRTDAVAAAEKVSLNTEVATHYALQNHFPGTTVANIDTDNDGLPNFFLLSATAEQIQASGLTADNDADNDGIADPEDLNPLVATH